jgi:hypothetical protein
MPKDWLEKHSEVLCLQRSEDDYQRSKDSELRAKTPLVWESIRRQVSADVGRLNSIHGNQEVQYVPAPGSFALKRANYPTTTAQAHFTDPHLVSYEIISKNAPERCTDGRAGTFCL